MTPAARIASPSRSLPYMRLIAGTAVVSTLVFMPAAAAQGDTRMLVAPASPLDPIASAVSEASHRFGVPEHWIRSVMRVESAGNRRAVSHAGAMGLMQVMPGTYAELRRRYGFGPDPFAIRDNIHAGTAYLREMFDRYGAPGFLGAYNAGPDRWEKHLAGARLLPGETIGYLARLGPMLGLTVKSRVATRPAVTVAMSRQRRILIGSNDDRTVIAPSVGEAAAERIIAREGASVPQRNELFVPTISVPTASVSPQPNASTLVVRSELFAPVESGRERR